MALKLICSDSRYAMVMPLRRQGSNSFFFPVNLFDPDIRRVRFSFNAEDSNDEAFLSSLLTNEPFAVAFKDYTAVLAMKRSERAPIAPIYEVVFEVLQTNFGLEAEAAFGSVSADRLAEMRAERLLFNQHLPTKSGDWTEGARELLIRGEGTPIQVIGSPFPGLYQSFGASTNKFLNISWIAAAGQLKLSACVTHISRLTLTLRGSELYIEFNGTRLRPGSTQGGVPMILNGSCQLVSSNNQLQFENVSQLGPKLRELSIKLSLVKVPSRTAEQLESLVAQIDRLLSGLPPR
jgi:hypothetical protein